jgi:hypothetical protein
LREKVAREAGRMRGADAEPGDERNITKFMIKFKSLHQHPSSVGSADTFSRKGRRKTIGWSSVVPAQPNIAGFSPHLRHDEV